jgi:very-short-patch-repair endonuclease
MASPVKQQAELLFAQHVLDHHLTTPVREYRFCLERRWRFDFAFLPEKLAVEIEGGVWTGGRHTRPQGFIDDCDKYNRAVLLGWRVLRFPTAQVLDGTAITTVCMALRETCCLP